MSIESQDVKNLKEWLSHRQGDEFVIEKNMIDGLIEHIERLEKENHQLHILVGPNKPIFN